MKDNESEIKRFLDIKAANGQSNWTIQGQRTVLMKLNYFLKSKPFRETTEDDIISFISEMNRKHAPSTMNLIKIVIKSFYRQLYGMKKHDYPPQVQNINGNNNHRRRVPIRPEDILTKEDIVEVVRYCDNFRDKAMVVVLYETAARIGEFVRIDIKHVKFDGKGAVLVIDGKTGSRRIRLIESIPFLQRWIESHPRKNEKNAPLWCSLVRDCGRLRIASVRQILTKLKKRSGIRKPLNPHAFRHSRLTELAKFLSDAKLKIFAGWSANSTMSAVYVHLSGKDLDSDLLKIAGVEIEQKPQVSPLLERECPRCRTRNPVNNTFCGLCGLVLDETKAVSQELDQEKLMNEIEELKDMYETAGEITDQLWKTIDQLTKEIKELKRQQ